MPTFTCTIRTPAGATRRDRIDAALLKAPVFSGVVEKVAVAPFARTLATLVGTLG